MLIGSALPGFSAKPLYQCIQRFDFFSVSSISGDCNGRLFFSNFLNAPGSDAGDSFCCTFFVGTLNYILITSSSLVAMWTSCQTPITYPQLPRRKSKLTFRTIGTRRSQKCLRPTNPSFGHLQRKEIVLPCMTDALVFFFYKDNIETCELSLRHIKL